MSQRVASFDIAKAIALFAVVLGHTQFAGVPKSIVDACFSFHMPLFFIVSGYFFKPQKDWRSFLCKNAKALLLPYVVTSVLVVALMVLQAAFEGSSAFDALTTWSIAALYGAGGPVATLPIGVTPIGAIWFLPALFWSKVLLNVALETEHPAIVCLGLFVFGVESTSRMWLPMSFQAAMCAVLFLYIGLVLRESHVLQKGRMSAAFWAVVWMVWLYCAAFHGEMYMVGNTYSAGALDVIGGVCGTLCIIKMSEVVIERIPVLSGIAESIGRNSLAFFCMHLIELDCVPWYLILERVQGIPYSWVLVVLLQLGFTALLAGIMYVAPSILSRVFYPKRRMLTAEEPRKA